jgi:hypothetical protein
LYKTSNPSALAQQAKQEQGLTHQAVLDRIQKVERLKEEWLALTADHEIKQQALETARKTQGTCLIQFFFCFCCILSVCLCCVSRLFKLVV